MGLDSCGAGTNTMRSGRDPERERGTETLRRTKPFGGRTRMRGRQGGGPGDVGRRANIDGWREKRGSVNRDKRRFRFQTKIVEELGCRGPCCLQVPCFVKDGVVARLYDARVKVKIDDVLVRGSVPEEYAGEIMTVQIASS